MNLSRFEVTHSKEDLSATQQRDRPELISHTSVINIQEEKIYQVAK
ncbi:hypothetical protein [Aurantivibrio plasticivorans]